MMWIDGLIIMKWFTITTGWLVFLLKETPYTQIVYVCGKKTTRQEPHIYLLWSAITGILIFFFVVIVL